jgi:hypothetical protein
MNNKCAIYDVQEKYQGQGKMVEARKDDMM